jgi:hypothetical protein
MSLGVESEIGIGALPCMDVQGFEVWRVLEGEEGVTLDIKEMRRTLVLLAERFVHEFQLKALILECSAMVIFKSDLRSRLRCAVYDVFDAFGLVRNGCFPLDESTNSSV